MRIEEGVKLDYADVLLRPKRSTLTSRKDVDLERTLRFYHSQKTWTGIPIMTANMATCGTFEMARVLVEYHMITTFHKYYTIQEYETFFRTFNHPDFIVYTLGIREEDMKQLKTMKEAGLLDQFSFICIDVPNGYVQRFLETVKLVRTLCPNHILIA